MELADIFAPVASDLSLVEEDLKKIARLIATSRQEGPGSGGILSKIVQHPFTVPGKRIRPALVLLCSRTVGAPEDPLAVIRLATSVEMLHAASLVHDDVIDGADTRRHQVSLNKLFGNRVAVLAGDILYTHFFTLVTGLPNVLAERRIAILDKFLETTKAMCMGEILAQEAGGPARNTLGFEEYVEISADKTASLFSACCGTAGMILGAGQPVVRSLEEFGLSFGLTFQMMDDLADGDSRLDPRIDLRAKAREYAAKARTVTDALPSNAYREKLRELVDFVISPAIC
jgi:geranylgeranyl pyrophosphate synthase